MRAPLSVWGGKKDRWFYSSWVAERGKERGSLDSWVLTREVGNPSPEGGGGWDLGDQLIPLGLQLSHFEN